LLPDDQVHPDTHVLTMVNNVIGVVNYVIAARSSLLNFMIADTDEAFSQALQMIRSSNHRGPGRMAHLVRVGGSVLHSHSRQIVNRETAPPGE